MLIAQNYEALQESPFTRGCRGACLEFLKSKYETTKERRKKHDLLFWQWCIFGCILTIYILNLVKKNKLDEKYSIVDYTFQIRILASYLFSEIGQWNCTKTSGEYIIHSYFTLLPFAIMIEGIYIVHITILITKETKTK